MLYRTLYTEVMGCVLMFEDGGDRSHAVTNSDMNSEGVPGSQRVHFQETPDASWTVVKAAPVSEFACLICTLAVALNANISTLATALTDCASSKTSEIVKCSWSSVLTRRVKLEA